MSIRIRTMLLTAVLSVVMIVLPLIAQDSNDNTTSEQATPATLLTDPFLQLPTADSVTVVWFTEWPGTGHIVSYGDDLDQTVTADTMQLSRMAEDAGSRVGTQVDGDTTIYDGYTKRDIYRHEATVDGLTAGERVPYTVSSTTETGEIVTSDTFSLQPLPEAGQPLQILLTSDHQLKTMTPANLEMVEQTADDIDAVFFAGDLVNVPDRASEWFDDNRGFAFFPGLQGNASHTLDRTTESNGITYNTQRTYVGGEIIQNAALFPVIGNHEVMGRYDTVTDVGAQFNDPRPRDAAEARYEQLADQVNPTADPAIREQWILDNSFNTISYEELFTLPQDGPEGEKYYSVSYGDVYLISLYSTRIWRTPSVGSRGKYSESLDSLNRPDDWGYGDFIFWDLREGSAQHTWLQEQLTSDAFRNARYQVVLLHQAPHGVGDNYNPVFTDPQQTIDYDEQGSHRGGALRVSYRPGHPDDGCAADAGRRRRRPDVLRSLAPVVPHAGKRHQLPRIVQRR